MNGPAEKKKIVLTRPPRRSIFNPPRSMSRRHWLIIPLAFMLAYFVHLAMKRYAEIHGFEKPRNVLLITVDGLRADRLGCYGYQPAGTPEIDALAEEGVRFSNAFATAPGTLPSHASILTGTYPLTHGVTRGGKTPLPPEIRTVSERLEQEGFMTGAVIGSSALAARFGLSKGFGHFLDNMPPTRQEGGYREKTADQVTREAVAWLSGAGERPFFLWIHYTDPNKPYRPPAEISDKYRGSPYDGEITYVDLGIYDVLRSLFDRGLYNETLVIFAGAHGEGLMEHGEETHGILIYNDTMKVPLIFYHTPSLPGGVQIEENVSLTDIAPTLLDILGFPAAPGFDGRSLLPLMEGQEGAPGRGILLETRFPETEYGWSPLSGLVKEEWKFILAPDRELYNLADDPGEKNNLFSAKEEKARDLEADLLAMREKLGKGGKIETDVPEQGPAGGGRAAPDAPLRGKDPKAMISLKGRLDEGLSQLKSANPDRAIGIFEEVLAVDPTNMAALTYLGMACLQAGQTEKAADRLAAARTLAPDRGEALYHLGIAYERLGRSNQALTHLMEIGRLDAYYHRALNRIGRIHAGRGEMDEAIGVWKQVLKEDPNQPDVRSNLARALFDRGDLSEAEAAYRQVLEGAPGSEEAMIDLGKIHLLRGETEEAANLFRKVLKLNPRSRKAKELLKKALQ